MTYDFIFIGTSPMCVLEACAKRLEGHTVLMIDRGNQPGGAWKTHSMFGHDDIENGPHFLLYQGGNKFLQEDLGIELKTVPNPQWLICDDACPRRLSDGAGMLHLAGRGLLKSVGRVPIAFRTRKARELSTSLRLARKAYRQFSTGLEFSLRRPVSAYLRNGSGPLVRALDRYARTIGVEFLMCTTVSEVKTGRNLETTVSFGTNPKSSVETNVKTRRLILTNHSCIDRFILNDELYNTQFDRRTRTQLHFFVESSEPLDFYLIRFFSEKYFLLSNLSYVYDREIAPTGQTLVTLALLDTTKPHQVSRAEMEFIAADLKRWQVLPPDAQVRDFMPTFYDDTVLRKKSQTFIEANSAGMIRFYGRADISEQMLERADHWRHSGLRTLRITDDPPGIRPAA